MTIKLSKLASIGAFRAIIGVFVVAFTITISSYRTPWITQIDEAMRDDFLRISARSDSENRIVIIEINDASLKEIGEWPWPRTKVADLIEMLLGEYEAKAVALDIVFPEPADKAGDQRLAALASHSPLVLAQVFDYAQRDTPNQEGILSGGKPTKTDEVGLLAHGFIANHSGFAKAKCVGNIGFTPDSDGILRHTPNVTQFQGQSYSSLSTALLDCVGATTTQSSAKLQSLRRVPYTYALSSYTVISAAQVLKNTAPVELIKGRYVLVGSSSLGLGDRFSIPLAPLSAGIMVHAENLSGLLDEDMSGYTYKAWNGFWIQAAWISLSVALIITAVATLSPIAGIGVLLTMCGGWLAIAFTGVKFHAEWSIAAPLLAYLMLLLTSVPYEWLLAKRKSDRIQSTFSRYVSQEVIDELFLLDLPLVLEPTLKNVTILVADMEGYTQATTRLSLDDAATLTKEFLETLTGPILMHKGTLDKYMGDGLVAFWGAPLICDEQADIAVSAALEIFSKLDLLNEVREKSGLAALRVRVGIESGTALVGDLGTSFRSTYTAVGDCINFASRLESMANTLANGLVIGPETAKKLKQHTSRFLGDVSLRGTNIKISAFTVDRPQ